MTHEPELQPTPDLVRPMLESAIERLIAILDVIDPDPDLEDGGDAEPDEDGEPILGWTGMQAAYGRYGTHDIDADGCELDEADAEPELGSLDAQHSQLSWSKGRDAELSLGSLDNLMNQSAWGRFAGKDFEMDCEDEGAQCDDEGAERSEPVGAEDWAYPDVLWADHAEVGRRKAVRS